MTHPWIHNIAARLQRALRRRVRLLAFNVPLLRIQNLIRAVTHTQINTDVLNGPSSEIVEDLHFGNVEEVGPFLGHGRVLERQQLVARVPSPGRVVHLQDGGIAEFGRVRHAHAAAGLFVACNNRPHRFRREVFGQE